MFAFKLAREAAGLTEASYSGPNTPSGLMQNPAFVALGTRYNDFSTH